MKHDGMARECAERLKPLGKTIKDATDFYLRHLNRKKSTGRPKGSGAYAGITRYMDWRQLRERVLKLSHRPQFDAKVLDRLETEMWGTRAKQQRAADQQKPRANVKLIEQRRALQAALTPEQFAERIRKRDGNTAAMLLPTTAPAGRFTDAMARDIFDALEQRKLPNGTLSVEGHEFERKGRVMDAIHDLAARLQFALKKQARKVKTVPLKSP